MAQPLPPELEAAYQRALAQGLPDLGNTTPGATSYGAINRALGPPARPTLGAVNYQENVRPAAAPGRAMSIRPTMDGPPPQLDLPPALTGHEMGGGVDPALLAELRRQEQIGQRDQDWAALAALSGAQSLQPFAQMVGRSGESRLKLAMQKAEHENARADRASEHATQRAFQAWQNSMYRKQQGVEGQEVTPAQADALVKLGINPAAIRNADEAAKIIQNPRFGSNVLAGKQFENKLVQQDELTPTQQEGIADLDTGLSMVKQIRGEKAKYDTGPFSGRMHALKRTLGVRGEADFGAFDAKVRNQLANYILSMSGKATSDREREFLQSIVPSTNDQDDLFNSKLQQFEEYLTTKRTAKLTDYEKGGRNVSNFRDGGGSVGTPLQQPQAAPAGGTDLRKKYGL